MSSARWFGALEGIRDQETVTALESSSKWKLPYGLSSAHYAHCQILFRLYALKAFFLCCNTVVHSTSIINETTPLSNITSLHGNQWAAVNKYDLDQCPVSSYCA